MASFMRYANAILREIEREQKRSLREEERELKQRKKQIYGNYIGEFQEGTDVIVPKRRTNRFDDQLKFFLIWILSVPLLILMFFAANSFEEKFIELFFALWILVLISYPSLNAIKNKEYGTSIPLVILCNLFFATFIGWIIAFYLSVGKRYHPERKMPKEDKQIYDNAMSTIEKFKNKDSEFLKYMSPSGVKKYLDKKIFSDKEIEILSEMFEKINQVKDKRMLSNKSTSKLLFPHRRRKARELGYFYEKDDKSIRDNRLREEGVLKDFIFWQFFAVNDDKSNVELEKEEEIKEMYYNYTDGWKSEWRVG